MPTFFESVRSLTARSRTLWVSSLLVLACMCGNIAVVRADGLDIAPIRVFIAYGDHSAIFTVINTTAQPERVQLTGFSWQQDSQGTLKLTPADELIFFPTLVDLAPLGSQQIRVGIESTPPEIERTFRIFIQSLPAFATPGVQKPTGPAVTFRTKIGIPVFMEPKAPVRALNLSNFALRDNKAAFTLDNTGNVFVLPTTIALTGLAADGSKVFQKSIAGWYVLAGNHSDYSVEIPKGACGRLSAVQFSLTSQFVTIDRKIPVERTGCQ